MVQQFYAGTAVQVIKLRRGRLRNASRPLAVAQGRQLAVVFLILEPMAASNGSQPAGPAMPGLAIELPAEVPILGAVAGAVVAIPLVAVLEGEARPVSPPSMPSWDPGAVLGDAAALLPDVADTKLPNVWAWLPEAVLCVWAAADAANDTANAVTIAGVLQRCMALSFCVGGLTTVAHAGFALRGLDRSFAVP